VSVYKAVQDRPHRVVALKVIKPGLTTSELLRRFEREADALARLQHPGIAQIYEVGTVESGVGPMPYFAMEYIDGSPLRSYADSHRLDAHQRLELIARVCDAVEPRPSARHHPSRLEAGPHPARRIGTAEDTGLRRGAHHRPRRSRHQTDRHRTGHRDPGLMSPEQVLADPFELDTRSDVYALGLILYELLTARLPYRVSGTLIDAARAIQEQEPARLSSIDRRYRGDVETIAAKALEKNKERRYSSAAALGAGHPSLSQARADRGPPGDDHLSAAEVRTAPQGAGRVGRPSCSRS
jgi:serine/threonine protein kinase